MEAGVGDLGEIVVLVVVAHIVGERVQRAVVAVRLLALQAAQHQRLSGPSHTSVLVVKWNTRGCHLTPDTCTVQSISWPSSRSHHTGTCMSPGRSAHCQSHPAWSFKPGRSTSRVQSPP